MDKFNKKQCFRFKTTFEMNGQTYIGDILNHQNFIAPNSALRFDEKFMLYADAEWMRLNIEQFDATLINKRFAKFHYGGLSTKPTLSSAFKNLRIDRYFYPRPKVDSKSDDNNSFQG